MNRFATSASRRARATLNCLGRRCTRAPGNGLLFAMTAASFAVATTPGDILSSRVDPARTGANLNERTLDLAEVRPSSFGRQFTYRLDGPVFSQPRVVRDIAGPEHRRRTLAIFTTAANTACAFDADGQQHRLVWRRPLDRLPPGKPASPRGIMCAPVIGAATGRLYVVAGFRDGARVRFLRRAPDPADGRDRPSSPVATEGAVSIEATALAFEPTERRMAVQRAGLALADGRIVIAFGGDFSRAGSSHSTRRTCARRPQPSARRARAVSALSRTTTLRTRPAPSSVPTVEAVPSSAFASRQRRPPPITTTATCSPVRSCGPAHRRRAGH